MASEQFSYELRIPKDRVAVIIGTKGDVKRQLEKLTNTTIEIDSKEGLATLTGNDALALFTCREIVRAIARGFNPDIAKLLIKQDYGFELLSFNDYARSQNDMIRLKGRVIGEGGKARRTIEELTGCYISVYGKTIGIIGEFEMLTSARRAVESLLSGSPHATVFKWLEKRRRELRTREFV